MKQNDCVRTICNIKRRRNINDFYIKTKILTFDKLCKSELGKLSYRYVHGNLPKRLVSLFDTRDHEYNTRNRNASLVSVHGSSLYDLGVILPELKVYGYHFQMI